MIKISIFNAILFYLLKIKDAPDTIHHALDTICKIARKWRIYAEEIQDNH